MMAANWTDYRRNSIRPNLSLVLLTAPLLFVMTAFASHTSDSSGPSAKDPEERASIDSEQASPSHSKLGVILPAAITVLLLGLASAFTAHEYWYKNQKSDEYTGEPEEEFLLILCTEDDAIFQYNLIIRGNILKLSS